MAITTKIGKNISKAKAKRIRQLQPIPSQRKQIFYALSELYRVFKIAERRNRLSPVQRIELEGYYTDKILEILELGNKYVSHSISYKLREKEPEE